MEENDVKETSVTEKKEANGPQASELNLNDLMSLRSILEVASQRGLFKAAELEAVGKVYNKLNNFLESVSKKES